MEEKQLSNSESLALIGKMIQVAKEDHRYSGDGWLIWGWLLFVASVSSAIFAFTGLGRYVGWIWTATLPIVIILYLYEAISAKKKVTVKTYVQELLDKFGTGFFVSLFSMIAASMINIHQSFNFGYYYILYAFWMYIHGSAIRFKPLIIGAYVNWAAAIGIFLVKDFAIAMLISSVAILVGYLIPGYMLRSIYKGKFNQQESL